jgi:hypothetical protein
MSDRKRDNEKKEKHIEMEEMDKQYMEMPMQDMHKNVHKQQMCPMMHQCPMVHQCPMMSGQMMHQMPMPMHMMGGYMMQQPKMQMPYMQGEDMRIKDWFDEWDEFSEDSSFDFDSDDFNLPEKYYKKFYKNHHHPFFWPPYFPYRK